MIKFRNFNAICATICTVIVLALIIGVATYASSSVGLSAHPVRIAHGPNPPPDGDIGDIRIAHGPNPPPDGDGGDVRIAHGRSEEHTSELQSRRDLVCRLLLEKKKKK